MKGAADKKAKQKTEEEQQLSRRQEMSSSSGPVAEPLPDASLLEISQQNPSLHGMKPALARQLISLQQTQGNVVVARMIADLQRENGDEETEAPSEDEMGDDYVREIEEIIAEPSAPGLTVAVANDVQALIDSGDRQGAIDRLVEHLDEDGQLDRDLLLDRKMFYSRSISGEGEAAPPGFARDTESGERTARPTRVRIGRAAFRRDTSWLYSSIMHEYKHVLQFQRPGASGTMGQAAIDWLIERQEVEAYAWEILNSRTTGMFHNPRQMRETWRRLHREHWVGLGPRGKRLLNDLYTRAHEVAQEAVGDDVTLPFRPVSS